MLILTRKAGERLIIGGDIVVKVVSVERGQARIGIDAPPNVRIVREEIADRPAPERKPRSIPYVCDNFLATANDKSKCHICLQSIDDHIAREMRAPAR